MQVVISSNVTNKSLVVKALLSIHLAQLVADAFTNEREAENEVQSAVVKLFGDEKRYRWYCIDQSDTIYTITFSGMLSPRLLMYQGIAAAIAPADAAALKIFMTESETVRPGRLIPTKPHHHHIQKAVA